MLLMGMMAVIAAVPLGLVWNRESSRAGSAVTDCLHHVTSRGSWWQPSLTCWLAAIREICVVPQFNRKQNLFFHEVVSTDFPLTLWEGSSSTMTNGWVRSRHLYCLTLAAHSALQLQYKAFFFHMNRLVCPLKLSVFPRCYFIWITVKTSQTVGGNWVEGKLEPTSIGSSVWAGHI